MTYLFSSSSVKLTRLLNYYIILILILYRIIQPEFILPALRTFLLYLLVLTEPQTLSRNVLITPICHLPSLLSKSSRSTMTLLFLSSFLSFLMQSFLKPIVQNNSLCSQVLHLWPHNSGGIQHAQQFLLFPIYSALLHFQSTFP